MNISTHKFLIPVVLLACYSASVMAENGKSVTIRGDNESPTVLYLVPWKKTPQTQGNTDFEMDMNFENKPLNRSEVMREIHYYQNAGQ